MNWNKLTEAAQIDEIKALSKEKPVLIFKHSTRCSISSMSLDRLLRKWKDQDLEKVTPYFLDLIAYRQLSDQVATEFKIPHESPQVILIQNAEAIYSNSHFGISYGELMEKV
ncbi:bacillithiol system redox-active protein YtxJ [Algoriphagus halophytocola]|uniref:Bacillithiol system redox-active protein YtxJ n=1 Tax=Algoriphagus halophytocola TaxID=2991499 RepID=A0ABY6MC77_9BACT|nr:MULTISPECIES: bacillithiol system redox-active protein YtxJ [unclassified Algoriphagus]UZD21276.1 bacillithiol system redox-active protein YtxJ [Algoriphagus sp. TR-M5]WBL42487.1 bacillithiol system redox-active protein YtxJ [Algoriphagus sp. TR-M9]